MSKPLPQQEIENIRHTLNRDQKYSHTDQRHKHANKLAVDALSNHWGPWAESDKGIIPDQNGVSPDWSRIDYLPHRTDSVIENPLKARPNVAEFCKLFYGFDPNKGCMDSHEAELQNRTYDEDIALYLENIITKTCSLPRIHALTARYAIRHTHEQAAILLKKVGIKGSYKVLHDTAVERIHGVLLYQSSLQDN